MTSRRATFLRETPDAAPRDAKVIDAKFTIVSGATWWRRLKRAALITLWFALAGFLAPPLWALIQHLRDAS